MQHLSLQFEYSNLVMVVHQTALELRLADYFVVLHWKAMDFLPTLLLVARLLADRYVIIENGKSVHSGNIEDLVEDSALVSRYLGAV